MSAPETACTHREAITMRAKKHVIVEKPFACTHAEAWKMADVCHERACS